MSDTSERWPELYRQAILESDSGRLLARIDEASDAVRRRSRELWYAGSNETKERQALDSALYFLGLLRMVGTDKGKRQSEQREWSR
jgi:hypothetical protein